MEIIFVLLPISLILALTALAFYCWGIKNDQFDDLETPAMRMLAEDDEKSSEINPRAAEEADPPE